MAGKKVQFLSVATNNYLSMWETLVKDIRDEIVHHNWFWILITDKVKEARELAENLGLADRVEVRPTLPFGFPLASMIRYSAIVNYCTADGWICYIDADMKIEDPGMLDSEIRKSATVTVVKHPGYTRPKGFSSKVGFKQNLENVRLQAIMGGLGEWENRRASKAFVPRRLRETYAQAAIFFGPSNKIINLSAQCWSWTEHDLRSGLVARWHDESYLNSWIATNEHRLVEPEFCFFDFPWLSKISHPIVRAVDKKK
jgi:hypothetical protein